jgi:O-antigen/teichoic acid export membrane protein
MPSGALPSLRERVLRAGGWSLAGYVLGQAVRFATNLLMTRLLVPEMFGVMAIALTVMIGLALFSDIGLRQSVVQNESGGEQNFLDTAWVVQILRGFAIALIAICAGLLFALAGRHALLPADSAYAAPVLPYVLAALGLGAAISGLESTKALEASRRLTLGRVTQLDIAAQLAGVACMLVLATVDRSIWILVAGSLAASAARTALTHAWLPGAGNRWRWDPAAFREIIGFGKWIFVSSVLGFVANAGDKILLGGMIAAGALGVYSIAFLLLSAVEQILVKVMSDVAFPALSEVARDRRSDLRETIYKFHWPLAIAAYLASGCLVVSAPSIVGLLYDARYQDAGWMLQILAAALVAVPSRVHTVCLLALGLSRLHSHLVGVRLAALFVAMPLGFHFFGLPGAIWGAVLSHYSMVPFTFAYGARERLLDLRKEVLALPAVGLGALLGIGIDFLVGR